MSRSIALRANCIERAKLAVKRNGFLSQRNLAESAGFSLATVGKFLRGKPVDVATFVELCAYLNIDWQEVADIERPEDRNGRGSGKGEPATEAAEPASPAATLPSAALEPVAERVEQFDRGDAPNPARFFGRNAELDRLQIWVERERAPVVSILGMGGIGKTTLAAKFVRQVQHCFERSIWRSLRNAPSLGALLESLLPHLSERSQVPESLDERLLLLARCLCDRRCAIVLDNVESILQAGRRGGGYRPGYEAYGQLFDLFAGLESGSCLLLTSREKPPEFAARTDIKSLSLSGLDPMAGWELLQAQTNFVGATAEGGYRLVERYGGNPLALKLVAATIQDFIAGNVADFLNALSEGPVLLDDIRQLLVEQFERLGEREREISYWLAIACDSVSWRDLQANLVARLSAGELLSALSDLDRRSLIEKQGDTFAQPAAVQEYLLGEFIDRICQEVTDRRSDWLCRYPLMQAQAPEYARTAQQKLILQPVAESLLLKFGDARALVRPLQEILAAARGASLESASGGYLASNIIHLIRHLGLPLSGWDFSDLPIWQAYLQGLDLQEVDFRNCHFSRTTFTQPFGSIRAIAFVPPGSSLGQALATGDTTGEVRIWGLQERQTIFSHRNHANWVCALAFSPDGSFLASGCADGVLNLWRATTNEIVLTLSAHDSWVMGVAFSPDGSLLASASGDRTLKLWNTTTGECVRVLRGHSRGVLCVAFSPDGRTLASGSTDGTIVLWDARTGECRRRLQGHSGGVWSVAFGILGPEVILASGGADNTIRIWSGRDGACLQTLEEHENWVWDVAFSAQGSFLASGSADGTVKLWDPVDGRCLRTLQGHGNWVWCVAFSPYCDSIASGSEDRTLRLWETDSGRCWLALKGSGNWVWSVAFSPTGETLASGSADRCVRLWSSAGDARENDSPQVLGRASGAIWSVAFGPDESAIVSGNEDGSILLWPYARTRTTVKTLPRVLIGHAQTVWSVAFSPDSRTLVSGSADRTLRIWDARSGQCLKVLRGHKHWVMGVAFSPDGQQVASASGDCTLKLWDVETGDCTRTLTGHASGLLAVAYSRDLLATAGTDRSVFLWDLKGEERPRILLGHQNWVASIAFSEDGRWLASGGADRTIRVWDVVSGECLRILRGHAGSVWSVAFQPGGHDRPLLASGSDDKTIRFWDALGGECYRTLATREPYAGMNLAGARGLTAAQQQTLEGLGAVVA